MIKHQNNQVKRRRSLLWLFFIERLSHGLLKVQYFTEWNVAEEAYSLHVIQEKRKKEDNFLMSLLSTHYPTPNSDWKSFHYVPPSECCTTNYTIDQ